MKRMGYLLILCFLFCLNVNVVHAGMVDDTDYTMLFNDAAKTDNRLLHGKTVGVTVKCYRNMDIHSPGLTYEEMMESPYRLAVVLENGVPVGRAGFYLDHGTWVCTDYIPNEIGLADAITLLGEDILVTNGMNCDHVVLPNEEHSVYSLKSIDSGIMTAEEPIMTLEEYVICRSYENQNMDLSMMGGNPVEYDEAYLNQAKAYWGIKDRMYPSVWIVFGCVLLGVMVKVCLKFHRRIKK